MDAAVLLPPDRRYVRDRGKTGNSENKINNSATLSSIIGTYYDNTTTTTIAAITIGN